MKSATHYGNGKETNEFGHPKVSKEITFVHAPWGLAGRRDLPNTGWLKDRAREHFEAHGCYPTHLHLQGKGAVTKYVAFCIGPVVIGLKIKTGAAEDCVA